MTLLMLSVANISRVGHRTSARASMPKSKAARAAFNEALTAKAADMSKAFESREETGGKEKSSKGKGKGKEKETQSALRMF